MKIILPTNEYSEMKLAEIVEEMKSLGRPTIRGHFDEDDTIDEFKAIEGAHRLRACELLDIIPILEHIEPDTLADDVDDLHTYYGADPLFVSEIGSWENYSIKIADWN